MTNLLSLRPINRSINLVQKPLEYAVVLLWLSAIGQFVSYAVVNQEIVNQEIVNQEIVNQEIVNIGWLLTALMIIPSSLIISFRVRNSFPIIILFFTGLFSSLILSHALIWSDLFHFRLNDVFVSVFGIYCLVFWFSLSLFSSSCYFSWLQKKSQSGVLRKNMALRFQSDVLLLSFLMLNLMMISLLVIDGSVSDSSFEFICSILILFLFIPSENVSQAVRGALLPLYAGFILVTILNAFSLEVHVNGLFFESKIIIAWAVFLWFSHHFIIAKFNRLAPKVAITSTLWPWYGLLLFALIISIQDLSVLFNHQFILALITYLFLMLRNTSSIFIRSAFMVLTYWLFALHLELSLKGIEAFTQQFLMFNLLLLLLSAIWDKYLQHYFVLLGWQSVSFKMPIAVGVFIVSLLSLFSHMALFFGFTMGFFDLSFFNYGLTNIVTSFLILVSFSAVFLYLDNRQLSHFVHLSAINMLFHIIFSSSSSSSLTISVPLFFALVQLLWIVFPTGLNFIEKKQRAMSLISKNLYDKKSDLIQSASAWSMLAFIVSLITLFSAISQTYFIFKISDLVLTLLVLLVSSLSLARKRTTEFWHVFSYLLVFALLLSLRLLIFGYAHLNEWDTIGAFAVSFIFYMANNFVNLSGRIINAHYVKKLLPLSVLLTIPWGIGSMQSSLSLFGLGVFYYVIKKDSKLMRYASFVFINLAVYLWIPMLSDYSHLLCVYTVPVALTLLLVSYLHRDEMQVGLQNKVRLLALSLFYLSISADIFLNDTLLIFVFALLIALLSVIYGVSSKTRAFLYSGVIFMVMIIFGQLMAFYPEGRLARALILMFLGVSITGAMIFFNIKRELLLEKIKLFRADLDLWD